MHFRVTIFIASLKIGMLRIHVLRIKIAKNFEVEFNFIFDTKYCICMHKSSKTYNRDLI